MFIDEFDFDFTNELIINCCPFVKFIFVQFTSTNEYFLFEILDIFMIIGTKLFEILISLLFTSFKLSSTEFGKLSNRSLLFNPVVAFTFEIALF